MMSGLDKWIPGLDPNNAWMVQVFIVVLITAVVSFIAKRLLLKLAKKVQLTKTLWDDIVFSALSRPAGWIIWIQGLAIIHWLCAEGRLPVAMLVMTYVVLPFLSILMVVALAVAGYLDAWFQLRRKVSTES